MKSPLRVKVLGKRFTIEYVPEGHPGLNGENRGLTDVFGQKIFIEQGMPPEMEQDTVLHEVLHCIEQAMGLELEELDIQKMATGILAVIKDNRGFSSYLRTNK